MYRNECQMYRNEPKCTEMNRCPASVGGRRRRSPSCPSVRPVVRRPSSVVCYDALRVHRSDIFLVSFAIQECRVIDISL